MYLPTPPHGQDVAKGQFFPWRLTGLSSEFSFSQNGFLAKTKEPSLPYYLPVGGGRIIGLLPLLLVLVRCEMQSARPGFELASLCPLPTYFFCLLGSLLSYTWDEFLIQEIKKQNTGSYLRRVRRTLHSQILVFC